jgi:hypothetical protein
MFGKNRNQQEKTYNNDKYQKERNVKSGRAEGDKILYYIFHSLFTALIFILFAIYFDFFILKSEYVTDLFTGSFILSVIYVFIVSIGANMFARVLAFYMIRGIYKHSVVKSIWELNSSGINKIGVRYFVATLITSLLFCLGVVVILSRKIFGTEDEVVAIIVVYLIIKIFVFIGTKILIDRSG